MIIGPEDTPYAHCPLIFSIELPDDYPFSSPKVQILSSDGQTRFHPNLYVNGKVCLSILGTWTGPAWSSVMSISTVLKSIHSLLEANPIANEPGWEKFTLENPRAKAYANWVQWRLAAHTTGLWRSWAQQCEGHLWEPFADVVEERGAELREKLFVLVRAKAAEGEREFVNIPYSMGGRTAWGKAAQAAAALAT